MIQPALRCSYVRVMQVKASAYENLVNLLIAAESVA